MAWVTGGSGFLGSHLCERLVADGHRVIATDNFSSGRRENLAHLVGHPNFQLLEHDVRTTPPTEVEGATRIYHLASLASPVFYGRLPIDTLTTGAEGTRQVLELAKRTGARVLLASTSEVYGDPLVHPQSEDYWGNVNPIGPRSCYDESKRYAEALAVAYQREHQVALRLVRIFNTYGPRMRLDDGRAVPNFLAQALRGEAITVYGDGSQTRSFCYVEDMIRGFLTLMESQVEGPVNMGNPEEMSLLAMAERIRVLTQSSSPIRHEALPTDDPKLRRPNIDRAKRELNWAPSVSLEEGLARTLAHFQSALGVVA